MADPSLDDLRRRIERLEARLDDRTDGGGTTEPRRRRSRVRTRAPKNRLFRSLIQASFDGLGAFTDMITGCAFRDDDRASDDGGPDDDRDDRDDDSLADGLADAIADFLRLPSRVADRVGRRSRERRRAR